VPPDLVVLHAEDITERKQAEEELHRHAYDDPLTGLPNRHAFTEILAAAARRADAHSSMTASATTGETACSRGSPGGSGSTPVRG